MIRVKMRYMVECDETDQEMIYCKSFQTKPYKVIRKEIIADDNIHIDDLLRSTCLKNHPRGVQINGSAEGVLKEIAGSKRTICISPIEKCGERYVLNNNGEWEDIYIV